MQISPKYPDFKQKSTSKGLWLDTAPDRLRQKIDGLVPSGSNGMKKNEKGKSGAFSILICSLRYDSFSGKILTLVFLCFYIFYTN